MLISFSFLLKLLNLAIKKYFSGNDIFQVPSIWYVCYVTI